jgi:hypothetical protein
LDLRISGYLRYSARPQKQHRNREENREIKRRRDPILKGLSPLWAPWRPKTRGENLSPSKGEAKEEEEGRGLSHPLSR